MAARVILEIVLILVVTVMIAWATTSSRHSISTCSVGTP